MFVPSLFPAPVTEVQIILDLCLTSVCNTVFPLDSWGKQSGVGFGFRFFGVRCDPLSSFEGPFSSLGVFLLGFQLWQCFEFACMPNLGWVKMYEHSKPITVPVPRTLCSNYKNSRRLQQICQLRLGIQMLLFLFLPPPLSSSTPPPHLPFSSNQGGGEAEISAGTDWIH